MVLEQALQNFSVAQVYNMIWRAGKDAAASLVREGITKKHAANTAVGSIQRFNERAIIEKWDVKRYGRDRRCPRSMVSYVLFDTALKIGNAGFNEKPGSVDISLV